MLIKEKGSTEWKPIAGGHHMKWKEGCEENTLPPPETPPPAPAPAPVEQPKCIAWRVQIWYSHVANLNSYVRAPSPAHSVTPTRGLTEGVYCESIKPPPIPERDMRAALSQSHALVAMGRSR